MSKAEAKYHYTESGLDNAYLVNGFDIEDDEVIIHDIIGLHNAIGMALVYKPGKLTGKEVRFIRNTLDLSQSRLGKLLGVTYQTILLWETGRQKITKGSDHFLRTLFFAYLNKEGDCSVYDRINEIAELDAKAMRKDMAFKQHSDAWKIAA